MQRDVVLWTTSKLSGSWSASEIASTLTVELLEQMVDVFERMEPLIRVRLLIACTFLEPARFRELAIALEALIKKAGTDDHEWVRLYGQALKSMDGNLHLENALDAFPVLKATVEDLTARLDSTDSGDTSYLRPLEEQFLSPRLMAKRGVVPPDLLQHNHFSVRSGGEETAAQLWDSRPGAAAVVAAAAVSGSKYSDVLSGVQPAPAQTARKKGDHHASMFVRSSHTLQTPTVAAPSYSMAASCGGAKSRVLEVQEAPLKPAAGSKRRSSSTLAQDGESSPYKRLGITAEGDLLAPPTDVPAISEGQLPPLEAPPFMIGFSAIAPGLKDDTDDFNSNEADDPAPNTF